MVEASRLSQAFEFADWLHKKQFRKQAEGEPESLRVAYMTHLAEVMAIVMQGHGDEDQQIAGLLHDALEDQPVTPDGRNTEEVIRERFGERVLGLVLACTDGVPDTNGVKPPWRERKASHIAHMREHAATNPDFLIVSISDKISNSLAIVNDVLNHGPRVWNRFNASAEYICWYYGEMLSVFADTLGADHHLVKRLDRQVKILQELATDTEQSVLSKG